MSKAVKVENPTPIIPMLQNDFISVLVLGGAIGLLVWIVGSLLHTYVFETYFCQSDINSQCSSAKNYAVAGASIVGAIAALGGLMRLRVYRPLLVVVAAVASMWGVVQLSWNLSWYIGILVAIVFFALAFGLFSWVSRIREFWVALAIIVLLFIAVRLAVTI